MTLLLFATVSTYLPAQAIDYSLINQNKLMKKHLLKSILTMLLCAVPFLAGAQTEPPVQPPAPADGESFTFTTTATSISLTLTPVKPDGFTGEMDWSQKSSFPWIDLNGNGTYEEGEKLDGTNGVNNDRALPKAGSYTVYVQELLGLSCSGNQLTSLNVSDLTNLSSLDCSNNLIGDAAMTELINSLAKRKASAGLGTLVVYDTTIENEGNVCTKDNVAKARTKVWVVFALSTEGKIHYEGSTFPSLADGESFTFTTTATSISLTLTPVKPDDYMGWMDWSQKGSFPWIDLNGNGTYEEGEKLDGPNNDMALPQAGSYTVYVQDLLKLFVTEAQLTALDVSGCTTLTFLDCSQNQLTSLDVSKNSALETLKCQNNQITTLDVSNLTALSLLNFFYNPLTTLDASGCTALKVITVNDYPLFQDRVTSVTTLTSLNVSGCTALSKLECNNNQLTSLNVSSCPALTNLDCSGNKLTSLDVSGCVALTTLYCQNNQLASLDLSAISSLERLDCYNNSLTSLDVTRQSNLGKLFCYKNRLTELSLSGLPLTKVYCNDNQLTKLELNDLPKLTTLYCYKNQLSALDVSTLPALDRLDCYSNNLTSLAIKDLPALATLNCYSNRLTSLSVENLPKLATLYCYSNQLTGLSLVNCPALTKLGCYDNLIDDAGTTAIVNALPTATGKLYFLNQKSGTDKNFCGNANVANAVAKKWQVLQYDVATKKWIAYPGVELFAVSYSAGESGTLTATLQNNASVVSGTEVTFTATPNEGYEVESWTVNGVTETSSEVTKTVTVTAETTVSVAFKKQQFAVNFSAGEGGSIAATAGEAEVKNADLIEYGTALTFTTTPNEGYEVESWTVNGVTETSSEVTKTVTVTAETTVSVTFKKQQFAVNFSAGEGGSIAAAAGENEVKNADLIEYGAALTFTATPNEGYEVESWTVNGVTETSSELTKTVTVTAATTVSVTFKKQQFAVHFSAGEGGTLTATVDGAAIETGAMVEVGKEVIFTAAVTQDNYQIESWSLNGKTITETVEGKEVNFAGTTYTLKVEAAAEVKVAFKDHTGLETLTSAETLTVYPNPASNVLHIAGLAPAAEVRLVSLSGQVVATAQADEAGCVTFDVATLPEGDYLLLTPAATRKVVIRR